MTGRTFSMNDQEDFAHLSGDWNPLHLDEEGARRLLFGFPVVHGVHALLWALDVFFEGFPRRFELKTLKASFDSPVAVGDGVECDFAVERAGAVAITLRSGGKSAAKCNAEFTETTRIDFQTGFAAKGRVEEPRELSFEEASRASGELPLYIDTRIAGRLFPSLSRSIPPSQLAVILATTRLIGMECPGLHSIYRALSLAFEGSSQGAAQLEFEVSSCDRRFSLVTLGVKAPGAEGELTAFYRPIPSRQLSMPEIGQAIVPGEFSAQRALVVGGSRGLGEVTAKILASGRAEVWITYHQGRKDAERVVSEIREAGGKASFSQLDVLDPRENFTEKLAPHASISHCYYFATPRIHATSPAEFSEREFTKLTNYYVGAFFRLFKSLCESRGEGVAFFAPSTVFLDEFNPSAKEYMLAKAASEALCAHLRRQYPKVPILCPRLPRLRTDQNMGLLPTPMEEPLTVLLPYVRELTRD